MLTPQGVAELADRLARLKGQGLAVIFITHKLHEAIAIGDRVSVLKAGAPGRALEPDELAGRRDDELQAAIVADHVRRARRSPSPISSSCRGRSRGTAPQRELLGAPVLELDGLEVSRPQRASSASTTSRSRCGRARSWASPASTATASASSPRRSPASGRRAAGDIRFFGHSIARLTVRQREKLGLRYVTDDRLDEGTVGPLSVGLNLVLKRIGQAPVLGARHRPARARSSATRAS